MGQNLVFCHHWVWSDLVHAMRSYGHLKAPKESIFSEKSVILVHVGASGPICLCYRFMPFGSFAVFKNMMWCDTHTSPASIRYDTIQHLQLWCDMHTTSRASISHIVDMSIKQCTIFIDNQMTLLQAIPTFKWDTGLNLWTGQLEGTTGGIEAESVGHIGRLEGF